MRTLVPPVLVMSLLACDQEYTELNLENKIQEFDQAPSNKVDILWVIDDSTSMNEEQLAVKAAGVDFIAQLESAEMDFHLGLVTTDGDSTNSKASILLGSPAVLTNECVADGTVCTYSEDFIDRVVQGTGGSDQEKGLEVALNAVRPPLSETHNDGFVRDGALLMIIQLSDENDCSDSGRLGPTATGEDCYSRYSELTPVGDLVGALRDAKAELGEGEVVMSGIIGPDVSENCQTAVPGKRYRDAFRMLGGVEADICLQDYSPVMQSLGLAATGITSNFQLDYAARYESDQADTTELDESKYNPKVWVTEVDSEKTAIAENAETGWTYMEDYAQIQFNGDSVPGRGARITVEFYNNGPVPDPPSES